MKLLTLLIAAALCGQAQEAIARERVEQESPLFRWGSLLNDRLAEIKERVEKLEKAVERIEKPYPPVALPSSKITIVMGNDKVVMTLAEANTLLVILANAINAASAQRAAEEWSREPKK